MLCFAPEPSKSIKANGKNDDKGMIMMKKMMIVDDDHNLRKLVRTYASLEGFECLEVANGPEALAGLNDEDFDIVILDVMMPGIDGFAVLKAIREFSKVPVIMLTARFQEYDKLTGFDLGVDDYVVKPFSPKELMARVNAVLKRLGHNSQNHLDFGSLRIEPDSRMVYLDRQELQLRPKEFDLLIKLARNAHIVLTKDQLLESIWGYDYHGDTRTLDTHIKLLRNHLGSHRDLIKTVWGVGYKFEYSQK